MDTISANLQAVKARIAAAAKQCGRDAGSIELLAVSKTFGADAVRSAHAAGQRVGIIVLVAGEVLRLIGAVVVGVGDVVAVVVVLGAAVVVGVAVEVLGFRRAAIHVVGHAVAVAVGHCGIALARRQHEVVGELQVDDAVVVVVEVGAAEIGRASCRERV